MIQQTSFLGISLHTRRRRQALVVGYYAFLLLFVSIPICRHKFMPSILLVQTFFLGTLFGGFRADGLVKPYRDSSNLSIDPSLRLEPISLNLTGVRTPFTSQLLDEREAAERDHAHFLAYRILCVSIVLVAIVFWLDLDLWYQALVTNSPTLLWLLVVYALSLPQSVILWTEPEPIADGPLTLLYPPVTSGPMP